MECLRCKGTGFFKGESIQIRVKHINHVSNLMAECFICKSCGHIEFFLPEEQLSQQMLYLRQDEKNMPITPDAKVTP